MHLIDYVESRGQDLAYYARELRDRPYLYGRHYLPHDAGYHQQAAAGRTIDSQLNALGVRPTSVLEKNAPLDGINQARLIFPRVLIDSVKCEALVDALSAYCADWDEKKADLKREPRHDWASHGADAFRYMAVSLLDFKGPRETSINPAMGLGFSPYRYQRQPRKALGVGVRPIR